MHQYRAPLRDMRFVLFEVLDIMKHYETLPGAQDADQETIEAIMAECAKFSEEVLAPLYQSGDEEGCQLEDGKVITPKGFKEAYQQFVDAGWPSLGMPEEFGGQGLPMSLNIVKVELNGTANWSWSMYPGLSVGAMNTLFLHGTDEQKQTYLPKMVDGSWLGTMCLTEPQCGTDLGQVKSRAEPNADGSYNITGTKIFISAGDHDWTDNIIHIVLARLPDAPAGTKGISLFIVPKNQFDENGNTTGSNNVVCSGLEKKLGIHGSTTAVLNFENSKGYLIGPKNRGLNCMFTFMNTARVGTAVQGLATSELSQQGALAYAKERMSMRSLTGKKRPDQVADLLIDHPDVRRMLLTQKAISEGARAMIYWTAKEADWMVFGQTEEERARADDELGLLTPIIKGFLTELGYESANLGMQVFGGHGYIREWGMEQIVRDGRIAMLYEGTTGIQALDLLGRKVMLGRGKTLKRFTSEIRDYSKQYTGLTQPANIRKMAKEMSRLARQWWWISLRLMATSMRDRDMIGSASVDYMMYSGYIFMGYMWLRMAVKAREALADENCTDRDFYKAKLRTADFYFARILPRTESLTKTMLASPGTLMELHEDHFALGI